tara:strand:- start:54850 stop:55686 length:837 start_codon:yes stop_codon:yes gene_type:complete
LLSYRHSFHAGNFADILKHIVAVEILEHLTKKDKPFEYIDTHSGTGLYNFKSAQARKLEEHAGGIGKLQQKEYPELTRYFDVVNSYNDKGQGNFYPGSPLFAKYFLRPQDRAWLFELHPEDFKTLCMNTSRQRKIKVACSDGLKGLDGLMPPASRRALVLIDPSYEIKTEYNQVFSAIEKAHKKFATGTYALWYPVVDRPTINKLKNKFIRSGIKNIQCFELGVRPDSDEHGMTSSGMIVVNPPWGLFDKMSKLLPKLAKTLGESDELIYKCDQLVDE